MVRTKKEKAMECSTSEDEDSDAVSEQIENSIDAKKSSDDAAEGRTLFVRNVPFECTEAQVQTLFEQFGDVDMCKLVINRSTETSAGKAFVKFVSKLAADSCLDSAEQLLLVGRRLHAVRAVTRSEAAQLSEEVIAKSVSTSSGSRNLHLAREGLVRAGTRDAADLSATELSRRQALEAAKRAKLRNPSVFISPVRLCVHNLSPSVEDKVLMTVMKSATGDKTAWVSECRIMRDLSRVNSEGVAKSRGYAFVTFKEHKHALTALRALNNQSPADLPGHGNGPDGGPRRRLIIEFSLENRSALESKARRLERARQKSASSRGEKYSRGPATSSLQMAVVDKSDYSGGNRDKIGKRVLPSHSGAKVRHKPRSGSAALPKKPGGRMSRSEFRRQRAVDRGYVQPDVPPPNQKRKSTHAFKTKNVPKKKRKIY